MGSSGRRRRSVVVVGWVVALIASIGHLHTQGRTFDLLTAGVTEVGSQTGRTASLYEDCGQSF